ncbi:MAG TPA: hypothetical protein VFB80_09400 [Pirellulaceae bacterium]|nr:hypothetical protein [Pirellulaceae bacterium]
MSTPAWRVILIVVVCIVTPGASAADDLAAALGSTLAKNAGHARQWHAEKDFKSVAQTAGGLSLLAQLMQARSDDAAWQSATKNVAAAIGELQAAARGEDATKCAAALDLLDKSIAAAQALSPAGQPQAPPRSPGVRPLMLAMDGIYADAKVALIAGNVAAAKNQARVLAELGKLVSNSKMGEQWTTMAGGFSQAALTAANSSETDPQRFRSVLRGVSQRCDACHEVRDAGR